MEDEVTKIVADAVQRAIRTLTGESGLLRVYTSFPDLNTTHIRVTTASTDRTYKCVFSEVRE